MRLHEDLKPISKNLFSVLPSVILRPLDRAALGSSPIKKLINEKEFDIRRSPLKLFDISMEKMYKKPQDYGIETLISQQTGRYTIKLSKITERLAVDFYEEPLDVFIKKYELDGDVEGLKRIQSSFKELVKKAKEGKLTQSELELIYGKAKEFYDSVKNNVKTDLETALYKTLADAIATGSVKKFKKNKWEKAVNSIERKIAELGKTTYGELYAKVSKTYYPYLKEALIYLQELGKIVITKREKSPHRPGRTATLIFYLGEKAPEYQQSGVDQVFCVNSPQLLRYLSGFSLNFPEQTSMTLGEFLRKRRKELGLTRKDLSRKADNIFTPRYVSTLERDGAMPTARVLKALAKALEVDPLFLLSLIPPKD